MMGVGNGFVCIGGWFGVCALVLACGRDGPSSKLGKNSPSPSLHHPTPNGVTSPPTPTAPQAPLPPEFDARIAALGWATPVQKSPDSNSYVVGYLRAGAVIPAKKTPEGQEGCREGWVSVYPTGFVCLAPDNVTWDINHPIVRAMDRRPDTTARLPYLYGTVRRPVPSMRVFLRGSKLRVRSLASNNAC